VNWLILDNDYQNQTLSILPTASKGCQPLFRNTNSYKLTM